MNPEIEKMDIDEVYRLLFNKFNIEKDEADTLCNKDEHKVRELLEECLETAKVGELNEAVFTADKETKDDKEITRKAKYKLTPENEQRISDEDEMKKTIREGAEDTAKKRAAKQKAQSNPSQAAKTPTNRPQKAQKPSLPASQQPEDAEDAPKTSEGGDLEDLFKELDGKEPEDFDTSSDSR